MITLLGILWVATPRAGVNGLSPGPFTFFTALIFWVDNGFNPLDVKVPLRIQSQYLLAARN